jgi:hypothetical protein
MSHARLKGFTELLVVKRGLNLGHGLKLLPLVQDEIK